MTKKRLWLVACLGSLLALNSAIAQFPQLPSTLPSGSQPTPVPEELSGVKAGNTETAVQVNNQAASPVPSSLTTPPNMINAAGLATPNQDSALQQAAVVDPADPSQDPVNLASGQNTQDINGNRVSANTISFANANGPFTNKPSIQSLTRTGADPTPSFLKSTSDKTEAPQMGFEAVGPTLRVETVGPRSISINKPSIYQIRIHNSGNIEAKGINIAASFPEFIELLSARPTAGTHDHTPDDPKGRLKWRIDNLPAGQSETLAINLTPRQAQLFDLQVEWSTDPIRGFSTIEITEPKLEMKIAGPSDVLYGEKAIYTITIRNPGTGIAEDVEIMLSEELGGQRAAVGDIQPSSERSFEVELIPGEAGNLQLEAFATADNLEHSVAKEIMVRRAVLEVDAQGPPAVYAENTCTYNLVVRNTGDAIARDVIAATVLPTGATYVSGIEGAEQVDSGLRWAIGALAPGTEREFQIKCVLHQPGDLRLEAGVRGAGDLAATNVVNTRVEALADLVLSVEDPKGPLPIEQEMVYTLRVRNRGTKAAYNIQLAMQFSEGIEPINASGVEFRIEPGQITFRELAKIDVGQEVLIKVVANASQPGTKRFRAILNGTDPKTEESVMGTTKFFGSEITTSVANQPEDDSPAGGNLDSSLRR